MMKRIAVFACAAALCLTGLYASADGNMTAETAAEKLLSEMTLHEKICQLFFVRPEDFSRIKTVTKGSQNLRKGFERFPVGGVILFGQNMTKDNLRDLNDAMQTYARANHGIGLFIGSDEEGGSVSRVANKLKLKERQPEAETVGQGPPEDAYQSARTIGQYLSGYGFNLDFAPLADIRADLTGAEITTRSYGWKPEDVAPRVAAFVTGLKEENVISVLKHFPGHGAVRGNTHDGPGRSLRTLEDWKEWEFIPFRAGIDAGAGMVMMSHQLAGMVDRENPASLSPTIVGILRTECGYDGVVITDALRMDAVKEENDSGEASVRALEAGCDMLLLPYNFTNAYNGVAGAVKSGRLTEERINESVRRILRLKYQWGLLGTEPGAQ